jgi:hypothetical protein
VILRKVLVVCQPAEKIGVHGGACFDLNGDHAAPPINQDINLSLLVVAPEMHGELLPVMQVPLVHLTHYPAFEQRPAPRV